MMRKIPVLVLLSCASILAAGVVAVAVAGTAGAVGTAATAAPRAAAARQAAAAVGSAAALDARWYGATPYLMPLSNNPPDATQVMAATGQKSFQLAFILAKGSDCAAAWDGTGAVSDDTAVGGVINTIRGAGGDVSVSIGGYNGTKLGQVCGSADATAAAYQGVVNKYGLHAMDFDLEEPEYENTAAIANELGAAKILQQNNPGMVVSVTMPGTTDGGTGWFGQQLLNQAKAINFTPHDFSIMPFDGGFNGAASQTASLDKFHNLLTTTFGWDSATAFGHEGVSMMNGRTDTAEYFSQNDFQAVLDYATGHGLARYTFWSINRDRQCDPVDPGTVSGTCSGVAQAPWEFTKFTARFAGAAPPVTNPPPPPTTTTPPPGNPPPTTTNPPAPGGGSCPAAWGATTAYNGGAEVSYGGHKWSAKWWTYGDVPGHNGPDVWVDEGAC
jgi:chitinase